MDGGGGGGLRTLFYRKKIITKQTGEFSEQNYLAKDL